MVSSTPTATLVNVIAGRDDSTWEARAIRTASVIFVAALTAAAAQVSVPLPFTQVPLTLQPMVVLLGGLALGARLGMASQVLYLAAGIAGLPVFATSVTLPPGALRLLGPTGGYLMAYPAAAYLTGFLAEQGLDRRYVTSVLALAVGLFVIYTFGVTWLALFARIGAQPAAVGINQAIAGGVAPFLVTDVLKLFIAAAVLPGMWRLLGRDSR